MTANLSGVRCQLRRFGLVARQAETLVRFYEAAFGGIRTGSGRLDAGQSEKLLGVRGTARYITIRLGSELIDFLQFGRPGRCYPRASAASDVIFQHFAIVVPEMRLALERLCAIPGWTPITRGGPQRLPLSSGGVTAFKFRDPAGHPLELLELPPDNIPLKWRKGQGAIFFGIDHSAITVRDTSVSEQFYHGLGFMTSGRSVNQGPEQERLDDVTGAVVEVTALSAAGDGPHIELLCYRGVSRGAPIVCKSNDVAATRLELEFEAPPVIEASTAIKDRAYKLLDPDGHHLIVLNHSSHRGPRDG